MSDNPLLSDSRLPEFETFTADHVEPAMDEVLAANRRLVDDVGERAASGEPLDWDTFVAPLEAADERLNRLWAPISHVHAVCDSESMRAAYEACLPKLTAYATEVGQDTRLYAGYQAIANSDGFATLGAARQKIVTNALRDFRLSGVELAAEQQARFRAIRERLSNLSNTFSQNVLDATQGWSIDIADGDAALSGLPESALAVAKQEAVRAGVSGYRFTLHAPAYIAVMTYADDAALRRKMYHAFVTRASDQGPNAGKWDNSAIMTEILALRQELATLLGFGSYAEYSLEKKMASTPAEVMTFLNDLADRSKSQAEEEFKAVAEFAKSEFGTGELNAWDVGYYSEKLRQRRFAFSKEEVRQYFPAPRVLQGMFDIVGRLFAIDVRAAPPPQVWHDDVRFFQVYGKDEALVGEFYVDLYARDKKRGGAWMADCIGRRLTSGGIQIPVAFLTCNFTPPVGDQPALLTHDEVTTLFHEFGHGLHHLLTKVDEIGVSGINGVAWDAVELPSQFLENWCWESESLNLIAAHVDSGASLPGDLLEKMRAAKNFQSAMQMVRQLEFSLFDMHIHTHLRDPSSDAIQSTLERVRDQVSVVPTPRFNRFQHGFSHIFAGGYAAGYYSYKWAEVLSADAFSRFEEEGIFNAGTGAAFRREILEKGGSIEPMTLFTAFRGRKPTVDALLRHSGLAA